MLSIVPKPGRPHGPLARCGHTLLSEHLLVIRTDARAVEVVDTSAAQEHQRTEYGVRRLGWFGGRFGFTPHRCDACKRKRELEQSIVCPCCRRLVVFGDRVALTSTSLVRARSHYTRLFPFIVATENGSHAVICEACSDRNFRGESERGLWFGDRVMTYAAIKDEA